MNDPRGSLWRKWDLHVHTPASIYHNYGGSDDVAWERFAAAIEALPREFSVIGINDYLFLDGYKRILELKSQGRLRNIDTFLPVIEFRIARFAGTESKLRRINLHGAWQKLLAEQYRLGGKCSGSQRADQRLCLGHVEFALNDAPANDLADEDWC